MINVLIASFTFWSATFTNNYVASMLKIKEKPTRKTKSKIPWWKSISLVIKKTNGQAVCCLGSNHSIINHTDLRFPDYITKSVRSHEEVFWKLSVLKQKYQTS